MIRGERFRDFFFFFHYFGELLQEEEFERDIIEFIKQNRLNKMKDNYGFFKKTSFRSKIFEHIGKYFHKLPIFQFNSYSRCV